MDAFIGAFDILVLTYVMERYEPGKRCNEIYRPLRKHLLLLFTYILTNALQDV
jgi:hypothetical protein